MYFTYDNQSGAIENYGKFIVIDSHVWLGKVIQKEVVYSKAQLKVL